LAADSVLPSAAVPEIVGGLVLLGALARAASPRPVTSPAATIAITTAIAAGTAARFSVTRLSLCVRLRM
jgi:hypothetical protein